MNKNFQIVEELNEESEYLSEEEVEFESFINNRKITNNEIKMPDDKEYNNCEKINKFYNNSNEIIENKIEKNKNSFIFDGNLFKKHTKLSNCQRKDNIKRFIYKCEFNRHDEKLRHDLKKSFL